jgi:hypothetical protein
VIKGELRDVKEKVGKSWKKLKKSQKKSKKVKKSQKKSKQNQKSVKKVIPERELTVTHKHSDSKTTRHNNTR